MPCQPCDCNNSCNGGNTTPQPETLPPIVEITERRAPRDDSWLNIWHGDTWAGIWTDRIRREPVAPVEDWQSEPEDEQPQEEELVEPEEQPDSSPISEDIYYSFFFGLME